MLRKTISTIDIPKNAAKQPAAVWYIFTGKVTEIRQIARLILFELLIYLRYNNNNCENKSLAVAVDGERGNNEKNFIVNACDLPDRIGCGSVGKCCRR